MNAPTTIAEPPLDVAGALSDFRRAWTEKRQWGIGEMPSLPPFTRMQAQEAHDLVSDFYWSGGFVIYGEYRKLADDTRNAIEAAMFAKLAQKPGRLSPRELHTILRKRDGDDCWICGSELGDDVSVEHKLAKANGGSNSIDNLALTHRECNRDLGRLPVEAKEAARLAIQEARL